MEDGKPHYETMSYKEFSEWMKDKIYIDVRKTDFVCINCGKTNSHWCKKTEENIKGFVPKETKYFLF